MLSLAGDADRDGARDPEAGAAVVEFTLVAILLFWLLFGIITFGMILGFKQNMTHAAEEGARAGAVANCGSGVPAGTCAANRADAAGAAARSSVSGFDRTCEADADGLDCTVQTHDCGSSPALPPSSPTTPDCITVTLVYDYAGNPLVAPLPGLGLVTPETMRAAATSQVTDS